MTERKASAGDRVATRVSVYSLLLNIVLTVVKTAVGLAVQSDALLADAAHSGADVAGSIAVWIGLRWQDGQLTPITLTGTARPR
jgi:divalent metal cation (Fe/Co/Zn/Cd) transporter